MSRTASKTTTGRGAKVAFHADTVTLRRVDYERLLAKAGETLTGSGPALPKPDARGNFPAVDYLRASIAREVVRRRTAAGLSQSELGELAGVRQETISRIESGRRTAHARVMASIERALKEYEDRHRTRPRKRGIKR